MFVAVAFIAGSAGVASADPIPEELLENTHTGCMHSAAGLGALADPYCSCTTKQFRENFTLQEFLQLNAELLENASKQDGDLKMAGIQMPRIQKIAATCLTEITTR